MASSSIALLIQYVQQLRELADTAGTARPQIEAVTQALENLARHAVKQAHGGTIFTPPTRAELDALDQSLRKIESLSSAYKMLGSEIRMAALAVPQVARQISRLTQPVPLAPQVPLENIKAMRVPVTGDVAQLAGNEYRLMSALDIGIQNVTQQYSKMGFTVGSTKAQLDLINNAWQLQIELLKNVGGKLDLVKNVQARVGAFTGTQMAQTPLAGELETRLGPARFEAFNKELQRMGFSMENLNNVQIDAVNNVGRFSFAVTNQSGAVKAATFHFDRFGREVGQTYTRFKSFEDALASNISKVLRWSIAVGLVFGAMAKARQMITDMTALQDAMADVAVITGDYQSAMTEYFDSISQVAMNTGTNIMDVSKSVTAAMRAASGASESERAANAFNMLGDAAALAKLGNLSVAESSDILIASLRQMNMSMTDGDILLNKWIAVSRNAYVSLADLGQGFASASAAAEGAGVDVDMLNGLIAAMSEATKLSAEQSANSMRILFTSLQTPQAQEALQKYGIAVKDTDGELRDMADILVDINALITDFGDGAVLSEKAVNALGYALGGEGSRNATKMVALLKNLGRAFEISGISAKASGELDAALAIKTDTLKTSVEKLQTAFAAWAKTLGHEGGLLDFMTKITEGVTWLVTALSSLTKALGPATTAMLTFIAAWSIGTKVALPQRLGAMGENIFYAGVQRGGMLGGMQQKAGAAISEHPQAATSAIYGIVAGISQGLATGDWTRAAGVGIGTAFGHLVGGPVGGIIGAAIGDAFAEAAKFALADIGLGEPKTIAGMTKEEILTELKGRIFGPGFIGGIVEPLTKWIGGAQAKEMPEEDFLRTIIKTWSKEAPGYARANELIAALDKLTAVEAAQAEFGAPVAQPEMVQRYRGYQQQYMPELAQQFRERRAKMPFELARGEIESSREYGDMLERMQTLGNSMLPIFDAMTAGMELNGEAVGSASDMFTKMGTDMLDWSDESISFILDLATSISALRNEESMTAQQTQELADRLREFPEIYRAMAAAEVRKAFTIPGFQDFRENTQAEFDEIIAMARELQEQFIAQLGLPPEAFTDLEAWAAFAGAKFQWVEGVMQQFVSQAKQDFEEVKNAQEDAFNVRRLKDVDPSKMAEIAKQNRYWVEYLARLKGLTAQQYLNMEGEQFNLILGPGNVLQQLYSTSEAMLFTLQDIQDVEEKQLEGMWNIPTGATFWVPLTSLFYQQGQGGGGFPELPELLPPTTRTADNTGDIAGSSRGALGYLSSMTTALQDIKHYGGDQMIAIDLTPLQQFLSDFEMRRVEEVGVWLKKGEGKETERAQDIWGVLGDTLNKVVAFLANPASMLPKEIEPAWSAVEGFLHTLTDLVLGPSPAAVAREAGKPKGGGLEAPMPYAARPEQMMPVNVDVSIPNIRGDFTIQNTVTLDGRAISSYVNRILATALARIARATGTATTTRTAR